MTTVASSAAAERRPTARHQKATPWKIIFYLSTVLGSATGLGAFLVAFGFFSQSALYGFAGLPLLSMDYSGLSEAGATGIVKSLSVLSEGWTRKLMLLFLLGGGAALWLYQESWPRLRRLYSRPDACLLVHGGLLLLLGLALLGMIPITVLADGRERDRINQETLAEIAHLREAGRWTPVEEDQLITRRTYPVRGLFSPLTLSLRDRKPEDFLDPARSSAPATGYPLRRSSVDRFNARNLYGWIFLSVLVLSTLVVLAWRWSHELAEDWQRLQRRQRRQDADAAVQLLALGYQPETALQIIRWLVTPLLAIAVVTSIALLPLTQGVLLNSVIGEERVMVRLAEKERCYGPVEIVETKPAESAQRPGAEKVDKEKAQPPPLAMLRQLFPGFAASPAGRERHRSLDPLRYCAQEQGKEAQVTARLIDEALRSLIQQQRESLQYGKSLESYARALDGLVKWTKDSGCLQGLQQFELLKPPPNLFLRLPDAAEHYLARWIELQHHFGRTRSGYILRYPRGEERKALTLFDPLVDPSPLSSARWLVHQIPSECIDDIIVAPDSAKDEVARMERLYDGTIETQSFLDRLIQLHPKTIEVLLRLLDRGAAVPHHSVMVTALGTVAGALRESEPEASVLVARHLKKRLTNESLAPDDRGASATALQNLGGPLAARLLGESLVEPQRLPQATLGTGVTAAGYLINDVMRWRQEVGPRTSSSLAQPLPPDAQRLFDFLLWVVKNQGLSSNMRGTAATSLGNTRLPQAGPAVLEVARGAHQSADWTLLGPSVVALGSTGHEPARLFLRTVVADARAPMRLRGAAVLSLYALGIYGETPALLPLLSGEGVPGMLRGEAMIFIKALDPRALGPMGLACAKDESVAEEVRAGCLFALSLIEENESGDEGLTTALLPLTGAPSAKIREQACFTLAEYQARHGHIADVELEHRPTLCQAERASVEMKQPDFEQRHAYHLRRGKTLFSLDAEAYDEQ